MSVRSKIRNTTLTVLVAGAFISAQPFASSIMTSIRGGKGADSSSLCAQNNPFRTTPKPATTEKLAPGPTNSSPSSKPAASADIDAMKAKYQKQVDDYFKAVTAAVDDAAKYNDALFAAKQALTDSLSALVAAGGISGKTADALKKGLDGKELTTAEKADIDKYLATLPPEVRSQFERLLRRKGQDAGSPLPQGI